MYASFFGKTPKKGGRDFWSLDIDNKHFRATAERGGKLWNNNERNATVKTTLAVIIGNRGFFPDSLAAEGREYIPKRLNELGYEVVVLDTDTTKFGAVETRADAKECADLFQEYRGVIDGIVVSLPNFGGEDSIAEAIQMAGLDVPVLVHAWADDPAKMDIKHRRDAFCGKNSVCRNLSQLGISYSLTRNHTLDPASDEFASEINQFAATCRVVRGIRNCRIGAVGARPDGFRTMRNNEALLARQLGIQVVTLDLSEVIAAANALSNDDASVKAEVTAIEEYIKHSDVPPEALEKMAKLAVVLKRFKADNDLDALAIQCWTSLQKNYGIVPCTIMGMLSQELCAAACEVDTYGAISMRALMLASLQPAALVDLNNNGANPDDFVAFHCSNIAKAFLANCHMGYQAIIAGTVGQESTWGTTEGKFPGGQALTLFRLSDTPGGPLWSYITEGQTVETAIQTFGGYGVIRVPKLQKLLRTNCRMGGEHHVAIGLGVHAAAINEAFTRYFGIKNYWHNQPETD